MLKFFRKIRQSLLSENKFSKYLLYAIGEILLVVIGILIALQINNWNESRKIQGKEQVLLQQLKQEFQDDLKQLNDKISIREKIIASSKVLLNAIDQQLELPNDTLIFHLQRTLYTPTFNTNAKGFFTSKDVNLLKNDSLKNLLSKWPTKVDELFEEEVVLLNHRDNFYIPFLTKHIQTRDLYQQVEKDLGMIDLIYPQGSAPLDLIIGKTKRKENLSSILVADDLEDYLSFVALFSNIAKTQAVPLKEHMQLILDQISQDLKQ